jgi:hypothetical protein
MVTFGSSREIESCGGGYSVYCTENPFADHSIRLGTAEAVADRVAL